MVDQARRRRLIIRYTMARFKALQLGDCETKVTDSSPFWVRAWALGVKKELFGHCHWCCPYMVTCEDEAHKYELKRSDCHYCDCHVDYSKSE